MNFAPLPALYKLTTGTGTATGMGTGTGMFTHTNTHMHPVGWVRKWFKQVCTYKLLVLLALAIKL